jgi:hypothetical protein
MRPVFVAPVAQQPMTSSLRRPIAPARRDVRLLIAAVLYIALALISANPSVTLGAGVAGVINMKLLWRRGEPAILVAMVMFQWLQVTARVFDADVSGLPLSEIRTESGGGLVEAIVLGLIALVVLAVALRLSAGRVRDSAQWLRAEVAQLSPTRVLLTYLFLTLAGEALHAGAWQYLVFTQILLALSSLKVIPFVALACLAFLDHRGYRQLTFALLIETILGLSGYFADFKPAFYVLLMIAAAAQFRITYRRVAIGMLVAAGLVTLALFWMSIKQDYRAFLNRGTNTQSVQVSVRDRYQFMKSALERTSLSDLRSAIMPAVSRMEAVDMFAATIYYVPQTEPHTAGAIWAGALQHALMPRIIFPNKPVLANDSRSTRRFTGLLVAGEADGTSIGIGYIAESYVDFGRWGMWFPIFALGLVWGLVYRFVLKRLKHRVIAYGMIIICFLPVMFFETAASKQLGSGLSRFLVLIVAMHFWESRLWNAMRERGR